LMKAALAMTMTAMVGQSNAGFRENA